MRANPKVFLNRAGKIGQDEGSALERGLSIVGFQSYPSLEGITDYEAILSLLNEQDSKIKKRAAANFAGQLWAFSISMIEGDIVVLPLKATSQIALGKVSGLYKYQKIGGEWRHTRPVDWQRLDVLRSDFKQDLLYSFGAFMTVCQISRNDAETRVATVLRGQKDPGPSGEVRPDKKKDHDDDDDFTSITDLSQLADDQIVAHIQTQFVGHEFTRLIKWSCHTSKPSQTMFYPGKFDKGLSTNLANRFGRRRPCTKQRMLASQ